MASVGKTIKKVATKVVNTVTGVFKTPAAPQQEAAPAPPTIINMPTPEEAPRYKRMPTATDAETMMAGLRSRASAMRRKGRQSTILTDRVRDVVGATSQKLGG
jgi:hypothetical protein